jgi:DNA-binding beta-propeller fold protein YncE
MQAANALKPKTPPTNAEQRQPEHTFISHKNPGIYTFAIMRTCRIAFALLASALLSTCAVAQTGPYKILKTQKVGGEGGWDYIAADSEARRLYIARSGPSGNLHVYDLDSLAPIGEVATGSAHGAATDTELHHGFATSKPVTMFDTQTLKPIKTIDTGGNPDGYLADTIAHRVYILSHSAPNVTVLDAHDGAILGTIDIGGAVDGKGHLFIDIEDKDAIAVVDTATMKMTGKYDISSKGGGCAGLAIDKEHGILFAACRDKNNMIILNAADGRILTTLPIGVGCDGAEFNPKTLEVFSTQGDGTLTVIKESSPTTFAVEQTVATPPRARTITLDEKTGNLITATAQFGPAPATALGAKAARPPILPGTFAIVVVGK